MFTQFYNCEKFLCQVERAKINNYDILLGGISWFQDGFQLTEDLLWIDVFSGTQFMIIYSAFYEKILNFDFKPWDSVDYIISAISNRICCITPFISVQRDFGYSDVTHMNDGTNRIHKLFIKSSIQANIYRNISNYYNSINDSSITHITTDDCYIRTYSLLFYNDDNYKYLQRIFDNKDEFLIKLLYRNELENENTIFDIISDAIKNGEDAIIICNTNHKFTCNYDKNRLFEAIIQASILGCDILSGGGIGFNFSIPLKKNLFWVDQVFLSSFTVVFKKYFDLLLLNCKDLTWNSFEISYLQRTNHKMIMYPFISIPTSSSGITVLNNSSVNVEISEIFKISELKLKKYLSIKNMNL